MSKPNGVVIYSGPSEIDGKPIVCIATGLEDKSLNTKTGGGLIQTWILREDIAPHDAVKNGEDASICGDCQHRGTIVDGKNVGRSCYVTVFQAPLNVWKTYHRGKYPTVDDLAAPFAARGVRLGAYGDPAAVPVAVWEKVMADTAFGTGYTHQWKNPKFAGLAKWCMASVDSSAERVFAKILGFRTFRVKGENEPVEKGEGVCPASKEAGHKLTCDQCKACGGTKARAKCDEVINVHGTTGKVANHTRRRAA